MAERGDAGKSATQAAMLAWPALESAEEDQPARSARSAAEGLAGLPAVRTAGRRRGGADDPRELSALRGRLTSRDIARSRRRRIAAAVTAAGILIAGVGLVNGDRRPALPDLAGPDNGLPLDPTADWEARAQVTLAALHEQLDVIAETETAWTQHIAAQYQEVTTPQAVLEMLEAKDQLLREVAALEAQLSTAERLDQVREEVGVTEVQLATLDAAIGEDLDGEGPGSGEDRSGADVANPGSVPTDPTASAGAAVPPDLTLEALRLERELLAQSLAAQRAEEERLQRGVEAAREAPLPDTGDDTTPLAQEVLDLDQSDDPPGPGSPSTPAPPAIAQGRDPDVAPTPQITTSGPDDPDADDAPQDRPESDTDPGGQPDAGGPPEEASVANSGDAGPPDRADRPGNRDDQAESDDRGMIDEVGDTAGDTVDDLQDVVGLGDDDDDAPGGPAPGEAGREEGRGGPEGRDEPQDRPERPEPGVVEELGDTAGETVDGLQDTLGLGGADDRAAEDRNGEDDDTPTARDEGDSLSADAEERDERARDFRGETPVIDRLDDGLRDTPGTLEEVTGLGDDETIENVVAPAERRESDLPPPDDRSENDETEESETFPDLGSGSEAEGDEDTQHGGVERTDDEDGSLDSDQVQQLRVAGEVLDAVMPAVAEMLDPALEAAARASDDDDDVSDNGGSDNGEDHEQSGDILESGRSSDASADESSAEESSADESSSEQQADSQESDSQGSEGEDSNGGSDGFGSDSG